ncbi:MAG: F-box protein, partial [Myxococcota bacterium]
MLNTHRTNFLHLQHHIRSASKVMGIEATTSQTDLSKEIMGKALHTTDILETCFGFLSSCDVVTVSSVSKTWKRAARSDVIWKELFRQQNWFDLQSKQEVVVDAAQKIPLCPLLTDGALKRIHP